MLEMIVKIGVVAVEHTAEAQGRDAAADEEQTEHAEKKDPEALSFSARRGGFGLSGQRRGLHIALHDGSDARFVAQHDLLWLIGAAALRKILLFLIHSDCFSCRGTHWGAICPPASVTVKVKVVKPFSLVTAMCSLC